MLLHKIHSMSKERQLKKVYILYLSKIYIIYKHTSLLHM